MISGVFKVKKNYNKKYQDIVAASALLYRDMVVARALLNKDNADVGFPQESIDTEVDEFTKCESKRIIDTD